MEDAEAVAETMELVADRHAKMRAEQVTVSA